MGRSAVSRAQPQDPLGDAYRRYADGVRRAAYSVVRDSDLAEDVTQEVFLAMWVRPDRFNPERGTFDNLLRVMARSRALDVARRRSAAERARRRMRAERVQAAADPAETVVAISRGRELRGAVGRLPPEQRESISLAYWGDMTSAEVAIAHGVPSGTAKSRIRIGLAKLRRELDR